MDKAKALELIGAVAKASVRSYQVHNADRRGSTTIAIANETKAVRALLKALGVTDSVSDQEIDKAVGN